MAWTVKPPAATPPAGQEQPPEEPGFFRKLYDYMTTPDQAEVARINNELKTNPELQNGTSPQAIASAMRNILEGLPKAGSALWDWEREHIPGMKAHTDPALTNQQIEKPIDTALKVGTLGAMDDKTITDWTKHQPQNPSEQLAMGGIQMIPAMLGGGGTLGEKLVTRVAGPMLAMEGAGEVAHEYAPDWEPAARLVTGVLTGGRPLAPTAELAAAVRLLNSSKTGVKGIYDMLRRSGVSDAETMAKLDKLGIDQSNLMDVNNTALQTGQQLYSRGFGRDRTSKMLTARDEGTTARVNEDLRATMGPRINKDVRLDALKQRLSDLGDEQRGTHGAQVQPADLQSIIDDIDTRLGSEKSPSVRSALEEVRANLHIKKTAPNQPDALETASEPILSARQAIDERLYDSNGKIREGIGRKERQALLDMRAKINEALDTANPTLRAKDAEIEQAAKEKTAFDTGRKDVLTQGDKTFSAEEWQAKWDAMSEGEQAQARAGLTRKVDQMVDLTTNDRVGLKRVLIGAGKLNYQKIATVIGEENAAKLLGTLEREATWQNTRNKVLEGSKTADTQTFDEGHPVTEGLKDVATKAGAGGALASVPGAVGGGVLGLANRSLDAIGDAVMNARRNEMARLLVSNRTPDILKATKAMEGLRNIGWTRAGSLAGAAANSRNRQ